MVHALEEIRDSLVPQGVLIDLRPLADSWPIELVMGEKIIQVGCITDLPSGPAGDQAADDAMETANRSGWFNQHGSVIFPFYYYWDSLDEMTVHVKEKWADFAVIKPKVIRAARAVLREAGSGYLVRMRLKMQLSCWKKGF